MIVKLVCMQPYKYKFCLLKGLSNLLEVKYTIPACLDVVQLKQSKGQKINTKIGFPHPTASTGTPSYVQKFVCKIICLYKAHIYKPSFVQYLFYTIPCLYKTWIYKTSFVQNL